MNYKIILGISTVTILTLIYQYIKNIFNPNKRLLEGQELNQFNNQSNNQSINQSNNINNLNRVLNARYGISQKSNNNDFYLSNEELKDQTKMLEGLYKELGEFNHIYQERLFETLIPTQIRKTIVHLSSVDHPSPKDSESTYEFNLADRGTNGLRTFTNVVNFKLLSAQIPYVPHNIYGDSANASSTNVLIFNGSNVSIEEGYYTIYTLINTINNKLSTLGITATLTFDNVTKFITITAGGGVSITTNPLFKRLGFTHNGSGTTINASNIPDLSIHFIDIVYGNVHPRAATITTDDGNILKRIPLNGQPGDMIYYDAPHSDYISQELFNPDINSNIPTIELQFKRNDGSPYNFKGLHYDLKIEVTELIEPTLLNELASHMRRDRERFLKNEGKIEISSTDYILYNMDEPKTPVLGNTPKVA